MPPCLASSSRIPGIVVSLEIPGIRHEDARYVAFRKIRKTENPLPRGSRVSDVSLEISGIVVSLEVPVPRIFSCKNSGKIVKIDFSDSRDQNKITKFSWFFYTTSISYINPLFRAPRPLKPLKSRPRGQNPPGGPLIVHSDHRGPVSCLLYTSPSPRDYAASRMPSSA